MKARQARKAHQTGLELAVADSPVIDDKRRGQRVQPKRKDRVKPRPTDASTPTTGSTTPAGTTAPSSPTKGLPSTDGDQTPPAARAPRKPKQ